MRYQPIKLQDLYINSIIWFKDLFIYFLWTLLFFFFWGTWDWEQTYKNIKLNQMTSLHSLIVSVFFSNKIRQGMNTEELISQETTTNSSRGLGLGFVVSHDPPGIYILLIPLILSATYIIYIESCHGLWNGLSLFGFKKWCIHFSFSLFYFQILNLNK